jgi:predicted nucleic acid-binding protein
VFTEILSDPRLPDEVVEQLRPLVRLTTSPGFWERAGRLRAVVLARKRRAGVGDALIAQFRLDHDIPLITRDRSFNTFASFVALRLHD